MWISKLSSQLCRKTRAKSQSDFVVLAATVLLVSQNKRQDEDESRQKRSFSYLSKQGGAVDGFLAQGPPSISENVNSYLYMRVPCEAASHQRTRLRRHGTEEMMEETATKASLTSKYEVHWDQPLGEGAFGTVYPGKSRETGEAVAIKKIPKRFTNDESFQREMNALQHLRRAGGHPNIAQLRENFEEGDHYYLVIDLVQGGEMFDHLCDMGPYSEADAARLVRGVASSLAFMHGIGVIHGDLKPENLMLSCKSAGDAVVKVVDFGTSEVFEQDSPYCTKSSKCAANTPAYAPPEALANSKEQLEPSFDMWSLGVILYIMLTGVHPFDLHCSASDEEIQYAIISGRKPPLRKSPITAHLSKDSIALIEHLLQWKPEKRLTADQLLQNAWVKGETARKSKMADSDKKLSAFRAFKTKISEEVFKDMLSWTLKASGKELVEGRGHEVAKRTTLLERAFNNLDPTLQKVTKENGSKIPKSREGEKLSLSDFADLLADNMKNRFFPKGHVVYNEGDVGNAMYFINSGSVQVYTTDGFRKTLRTPGDFFGEGALVHPDKIRSASIVCLTPVHAIEISREYFEKYVASDQCMGLDVRAKVKTRERQRAKTMLGLQENMEERKFSRGDYLFKEGDAADEVYILEDGTVDISVQDHTVCSIEPGLMLGEHALLFGRPRNVTAQCVSDACKIHVLPARDFHSLLESHKSLGKIIREVCFKREFQKALCNSTKKPFPQNKQDLRAAFDDVVSKRTGSLDLENVRQMLHEFDPLYTEEEVCHILKSIDLDESGEVTWEEFKRIFEMDD